MRGLSDKHNALTEQLQLLNAGQQFDALLKTAAAQGLLVAAWRIPGKQQPCLLIDLDKQAKRVHPDLEKMPAGFLFAPFDTDLTAAQAEEDPQCCYLQADIFWDGAEQRIRFADNLSNAKQQRAEALLEASLQPVAAVHPFTVAGETEADMLRDDFLKLVEHSVEAIRRGYFQKVVCARTKTIVLPPGFSPEGFFKELSAAYATAFVSLISVPGIGTWMGASPEVLISVDSHNNFSTVALAGTQPKQPGMTMMDAVWRQKEIEEQAMVSRYIINCFKKVRVREFEEVGPRTVAAGNLLHLRTDFTVDLEEVEYPNLPTHMLQLLHPTSAVCGLPKPPAAAFLKQHEALNRKFFAGFLGPVNLQRETQLFVNLRCMQLLGSRAVLYAGAGITADSVPEREWQETEHKCQTLLNIINKA